MVVGICRLELSLPGSASLKEKRRVIKSLVDRLRSRFNVAVAETGYLDVWQRAELGMACVSNERKHVDHVLQDAIQWVEANTDGELLDYEIEIL